MVQNIHTCSIVISMNIRYGSKYTHTPATLCDKRDHKVQVKTNTHTFNIAKKTIVRHGSNCIQDTQITNTHNNHTCTNTADRHTDTHTFLHRHM